MMREIKRVLRPDGLLLISSPDRYQYSDVPGYRNPYHVKELYLDELVALLSRFFRNLKLYGQGVKFASVVGPLDDKAAPSGFMTFHKDAGREPVAEHGIGRPTYYIALASDGTLCDLPSGVFAGEDERIVALEAHAANLQGALESARASGADAEARVTSLQSELDTAHATLAAEHTRAAALQSELAAAHVTLAAADTHVITLQSELDAAHVTLAAADTRATTLQSELAREHVRFWPPEEDRATTLQGELESTRAERDERERQISGLRARLETVEAGLKERGTALETLEARIVAASARVGEHQDRERVLRGELHAARTSVAHAKAQVRQLQQELTTAEGHLSEHALFGQRTQGELRAEQTRVAELESTARRLENQLKTLRDELLGVLMSKSWTLTNPLRRGRRLLTKVRELGLARVAYWKVTGVLRTRLQRHEDLVLVEGSGLFDAAWYVAKYPNVAQSAATPLEHFVTDGWREGRDPHPLFDAAWYLGQHPERRPVWSQPPCALPRPRLARGIRSPFPVRHRLVPRAVP